MPLVSYTNNMGENMKRKTRSIISGALALTMSMGMVTNVNATTIEEAQKKADELQSQKNSTEAEKDSLTEQLTGIVKEMETAEEKLTAKQSEIQTAENDLVDAKIDENNQYDSMKKRIKFMYENGNTQMIETLIESKNIGDFLNKAEYISQISTYDREMLNQFQDVVKDVEAKEESLKTEYSELETLQNELISKQEEVQTMLNNTNVELADLEKQIGDNASTLKELIAQAEEEKRKQEEAAAAAAAAAAAQQQAQASNSNNSSNSNSNSGGSTYIPPSSSNTVSGSGQFVNPCPGASISSTFGYRDFDGAFHKGLDLAAGEGTPTYAAAAGTVVIAGWSDSAGNWVVINHGNGLVTKYMHHSALCVSAGQTVSAGQQIGYVGNTGNSFGAHLHFQVEVNGSAVNPQNYL